MTNQEIAALRNMGLSAGQIMRLAKNVKGTGANFSIGTTDINVQVPGSAVVFLGMAAITDDDTDITKVQFTLQLNNETIVDAVDLSYVTPKERCISGQGGYLETTRRLTGKDVLRLSIYSTVSGSAQMAFFYLNAFGEVAGQMANLRG